MIDAPSLILLLSGAASAGLVGAFALLKRTVLAGDVISHIAIPGLGLALIWNLNPLVGGSLTLFLGIFIIWAVQKKTQLTLEATIGVMFAASVSLGALLIESTEELIDALFGGFGNISQGEFFFGIGVSALILAALWLLRHELILGLFSPDLAKASGVKVDRINLWFLLIFGLAIIASLRFLGALLVGSLIIIPASAARQLTHTLGGFLAVSTVLAVLAAAIGFLIANTYGLETGPTVVIAATGFFLLSLLKKKR